MRLKARHDSNHTEVCKAFQKLGAAVLDLSHVGGGCPDILICIKNALALVEIKSEKGKLNPLQAKFHDSWPGHVWVVRDLEDVEIVCKYYRLG